MDFSSLPSKYCILNKLGTGSFATVWKALDFTTNKNVAIKVIPRENNLYSAQRIENETNICKSVNHEYIANLIDLVEDEKQVFLILELCSNGSLGDLVLKKGCLEEDEARRYFIQVASALKYLNQEAFIVHRDIKIDNIMLDSKNNAKIIDFGLSIEHHPEDPGLTKCCGSPSMCFSRDNNN